MQRRGFGAAVGHGDAHQDIVGIRLRVLGEHVEVPLIVEHTGVEELVLGLRLAPLTVDPDQALVGEFGLRVLVECLEIGVGRGGIEVEVGLLHILPVVSFGAGEAEQPLFQDRIPSVPQREAEAEAPLPVGDAEESVFTPPVGPAPRLIVGEVVPHIAILRVVLAHRAPLTLREVRPPPLPVALATSVLREALSFRSGHEVPPDAGRQPRVSSR